MTEELARTHATSVVLQRYHLTDLDEAQQRLSPGQFDGVLREIAAVEAQILTQSAPRPAAAPARGLSTPFGRIQTVTILLLVAIWVVFALENIYPIDTVINDFATTHDALSTGQYWRLLSGAFLHANMVHILSNSIGLIALGSLAEAAFGSLRFAAIYLTSALGGGLVVVAIGSDSVGASGAILGLIGAMVVGFWRNRRILNTVAARPLFNNLATMLVLNIAIGFVPGISLAGHLGGAITGALCALVIPFSHPQYGRRLNRAVDLLSMALIALAALVALSYLWAH